VLAKATLEQSFAKLFVGNPAYPATIPAAAQKWAQLYGAYARTAQAGPTLPTAALVDAQVLILTTAFGNAFTAARAAGSGYKPALVTALGAALTAFWPPIAFVGPGATGVATSPPPAALNTALNAFLGAVDAQGARPGADSQAHDLAGLLHDFTRSVMVVNTVGTTVNPPVALS
jgi:hypothetical protein